jgi:UDP-N-acetyl-D-glucosamine dehydrogenase
MSAARFRDDRWTAGVVGLGYVGLPLAITAVEAGLDCVGFDVSERVVSRLNGGSSHVGDVDDEQLAKALDSGLEITTDERALERCDALFLCVPSPLGRNRQPDMSYIEAAAAMVSRVVQPGMLVSLESTTYPGTTEDILVPAATSGGLALDSDVFVSFSPERVDPGNERRTGDIPKVVGGVTEASGAVAKAAYARLVPSVHMVSSARAAELTKLLENTYRAVNIGLINEIAQLSHQLDIDVWEVVDAAATKPFGFQAFYPGPGVGGHCIPLDPQFLAWRAREAKFATRFIDIAEQVNSTMPAYTADRVAGLLNIAGKPVYGTRVLGIGVAYKPNVADDRESPAWDVLTNLAGRGAEVAVLDPLVQPEAIVGHGYAAVDVSDSLDDFAIGVLLTDHRAFDLAKIAERLPMVFDTRGAYRRAGISADNVVAL